MHLRYMAEVSLAIALGDTEAGQADIPNALLIEADTPEWFVARGIKAPSRVRS